MINFDPSKISFEIVRLKSISMALGGSISIVSSTEGKTEILKRIEVPLSVARDFIIRCKKVTKYLKPTLTCVVRYENHVIALERHPLSSLGTLETEGVFGTKIWEPECKRIFENILIPLVSNQNKRWFFDSRYIFSFDEPDLRVTVNNGHCISRDGKFRKLHSTAIDLQHLHHRDKIAPTQRTCLAFLAGSGEFAISPPIWKDLSNIGTAQSKKAGVGDEFDDENDATITSDSAIDMFDKINDLLAVNLNFALKAGSEIGRAFGYEAVEPLHLPRLMIELHTVNLPNVPKEVKATYDIGLQFMHAVAWLLGMSRKANNLETYLMIRSTLKYLTTKGIFRKNIFDASRVFKEKVTVHDIPQLKVAELMKDRNFDNMSLSVIVEQAKRAALTQRHKNGQSVIGDMMNEEE